MIGEEEHQFDIAGLILDQHFERRLGARVRRRAMFDDAHFQSGDRVPGRIADFRPRPPVERRIRQVEQEIDDARARRAIEQAIDQLGDFRADARQRGGGSEQRVEQSGAHRRDIAEKPAAKPAAALIRCLREGGLSD